MVSLEMCGGVRSSLVVQLSWLVWSLVTASTGQTAPRPPVLLRGAGAGGMRTAWGKRRVSHPELGGYPLSSLLAERQAAGPGGGGGRPHPVSFHSTFWNRAQSCAEGAAPQVSPGVVGHSLSSPRCLEAAGRRSAGVPGVTWLDLAAEAEQREQAGLRTARWLHLEIGGRGAQEAWGGGHRSPGG